MEWRRVERRLFRASAEALGRFAKDHLTESFYGFIFDCNAEYGEVLLCLNTEQGLAEASSRHYPSYSQSEIDSRLRWNAGDWKYQGFNTEPLFAESWEKAGSGTQDAIHSAYLEDESDEVPSRFLECVCRVLIVMEDARVFSCLTRDPGFKALVSDHDEALEDAWHRLLQIRNRGGAG